MIVGCFLFTYYYVVLFFSLFLQIYDTWPADDNIDFGVSKPKSLNLQYFELYLPFPIYDRIMLTRALMELPYSNTVCNHRDPIRGFTNISPT